MPKPIKRIFWDWNGTLLDDCAYAIAVRNRIFPQFGLPAIADIATYREQFTFPVRIYYERAGVTEDIFDEVAHAWMNEYVRGQATIPLQEGAKETLAALKEKGIKQAILTASERTIITQQLQDTGVAKYFDTVLALDDIYAHSKVAVGCAFLQQSGENPQECVLIGDTLHDADVAKAMGVACVLVAKGHHSKERLRTCGVPVMDCLSEACNYIMD